MATISAQALQKALAKNFVEKAALAEKRLKVPTLRIVLQAIRKKSFHTEVEEILQGLGLEYVKFFFEGSETNWVESMPVLKRKYWHSPGIGEVDLFHPSYLGIGREVIHNEKKYVVVKNDFIPGNAVRFAECRFIMVPKAALRKF